MGVEFVIREAFSKAKEYMAAWDRYNKSKTQKGFRGAPPAYDLRLETLADILRGDIIVHCHSYRADEIFMLLKVCQDFGIKKLVFQHVNEGFKVAPELAKFGAMASVFADWWAYKFEVYYSTAYNAAILTKNGVTTSINSDDGELMRHLYHEAAKTQKYGALSDDEALSLITLNPAKQLGIESRVGSLEVGKEADVAIFKGHPLSTYTVPMITIVDGVVRFDREKDADDMRIYIDPSLSHLMHRPQRTRTRTALRLVCRARRKLLIICLTLTERIVYFRIKIKSIIALIACLLLAGNGFAQSPKGEYGTFALTNATIETITKGSIQNGTVSNKQW